MRIVFIVTLIGLCGIGLIYLSKPKVADMSQSKDVTSEKLLKVVAVGDISCDDMPVTNSQCQQGITAKLAESLNPDLVLILGDLQYGQATLEYFTSYYDKSWGKLKSKTRPAVGNHEYEEASAAGYFDYFNGEKDLLDIAGPRDKGYYSFENNGWKLIALNSNCWAAGGCDMESPQGKWLSEELKKSKQSCQLVYFHHPLFSSALHGSFELVRPLWKIMYDNQVELVLNGHDHLYERFAHQDADGNPKSDGIREFVSGTGGRNLYKVKDIMPNSEIRIDDQFGVLELELKSQEYNWRFISSDNQVLDSGSDSCHISQTSTL